MNDKPDWANFMDEPLTPEEKAMIPCQRESSIEGIRPMAAGDAADHMADAYGKGQEHGYADGYGDALAGNKPWCTPTKSEDLPVNRIAPSLSPEMASKWVDCKQELPECGQLCIVVSSGVVQHALYSFEDEVTGWRPFDEDFDPAPFGTFTHWMPLPAPPETRLDALEGKS